MCLHWGTDASRIPAPAHHAGTFHLRFELATDDNKAGRMLLWHVVNQARPCSDAAPDKPFHATISLAEHAWTELTRQAADGGLRRFSAAAELPLELPLSPAARLAVESIRRCPFGGAFREMALTARCHDLLLEFFSALGAFAAARSVTVLRTLEQQIRCAAQMLEESLETPPALCEIARRTGLSETTLKRGFRQLFRTTPMGYVRERRMQRARTALQDGTATVLEAAALVGYSNPSNFAAAFRRQFGVNPKQFQMAVRR